MEKTKQIKPIKKTSKGYPRGYQASINAYMDGFNKSKFVYPETKKEANGMLEIYNGIIKEAWRLAKETAVEAIISIETDIKKAELLYGKSKTSEVLEAKKAVLHFICWSLPNIEEEEING